MGTVSLVYAAENVVRIKRLLSSRDLSFIAN